ncbi:amidase [Salipaludibacillus neizhouensis]|uniref:Amidase n=1 Tax=Salipaludibacillus neizhouensis TaxID=885475 RepID=A0A3A9KBD2_9BACI|nr:amidase [Salipaludibacillus neizhouensis]RKL67852.1 amidase [Salipaludibacillus neizhouensis]
MKKIVMVVVLIFIIAGSISFNVHALDKQDRATWLWNPWMFANDEDGTVTFLESKNVNKVYVQIDQEMSIPDYQSFIEKASAKGISIYALDGAPDWVAPKGARNQSKMLSWLENYQQESSTAQAFAGVHLDVEPYLYSGWSKNQAKTVTAFQSLLTDAKTRTESLGLPLEVDLPFWFDEITYKNSFGKGILAEWVIANMDSVTIMAYRDSAPMIIDIVKNEVAYAGQHGTALVIGVETGQTREGDRITFYEEGETYMNQQLEMVNNHYANYPGFNGIGIHHVDSWKNIKP